MLGRGDARGQCRAKPQAKREMVVTDKDREFWSYRPLDAPQPPAVNDVAWPKNSVDAVRAREARGEGPRRPPRRPTSAR
jgi:hypothetical protein